MIELFLDGQNLEVRTPPLVAGTVDYLTVKIYRGEDWRGLSLHVFFQSDSATYELLTDGSFIDKDSHLNLYAGRWGVSVVGYEFKDDQMIEKITTNTIGIKVAPAPPSAGDSLPNIPETAYEHIEAIAQSVRDDADAGKFKGEKGDTAITCRVGSTTTGAAGTNALVTNSGTYKDLVFDFTIPRGDTGNAEWGGIYGTITDQTDLTSLLTSELSSKANTSDVVPKTGGTFTGDVTFNGVLDVTQRRYSATLSTAGWYRVASCSLSGSIIDVSVGVSTQQAIDAEVLLSSSSVAQIVVKNSQASNAISGIRVMLGDGSFHIDIQKANSASVTVSVDLTPHGNARIPGNLTAASLTSVNNSPFGETELAIISITKKTSPLSSPTSTITYGTIANSTTFTYTATEPCWFYYVPVLQAGISGGFTVSLNSVTLASYTSGEAIDVNVAAIPVPMQTGDVLDITQNSNRTSSYRVLTMRGAS